MSPRDTQNSYYMRASGLANAYKIAVNMSCPLGIDLGTSSVKMVVFAVEAFIKGIGLAEYPILTPRVCRFTEFCDACSRYCYIGLAGC
jgi:hypothetical protein